jgi:putative AdoMet-dependent methyltransferase
MTNEERIELFDRWAASYDRAVERAGFPFDGYDAVLGTIVRHAATEPSHRVLDVGIGTGNLAQRIAPIGCEIWGVDFSHEMIERARKRLPGVRLVQADLLTGWPDALPERFDRIVSAYVFHEFPDGVKLRLLSELAEHLTPGGRIVLGDIGFQDAGERDTAHREWAEAWDENEHYWATAEIRPSLGARGFDVDAEQVSFCGAVLTLRCTEAR